MYALASGMAICVSFLGSFTSTQDEEQRRIWAALTERHEQANTAEVRWTQRLVASGRSVVMESLRDGEGEPPADFSSKVQDFGSIPCRLVIAGDQQLLLESPELAAERGDVRLLRSLVSFDGAEMRTFRQDAGSERIPMGGMTRRRRAPYWASVHILPLTMSLRPLRLEAFGKEPSAWKLQSTEAVVEGRRCLVIERGLGSPLHRVVYLDRERRYIPLKLVENLVEITMRYERAEEPTWVPSSWKSSVLIGGRLDSESENQVEAVELNSPLAEGTFRLVFPPGTRVADGRGKRPAIYTVSGNGQLLPYRAAVAQRTAYADWGKWPFVLAAVAAAAFGAALFIWYRRVAAT